MSVSPYSSSTHFPGAAAEIVAPPSLASLDSTSYSDGTWVDAGTGVGLPDLNAEPWTTDLPGKTLTITASTGGSTGAYTIDDVDASDALTLTSNPGDGTDVAWNCTPTGHSGLDDVARRLQNGWTDSQSASQDPIPTTIIGGRIITEAAPDDDAIAAY